MGKITQFKLRVIEWHRQANDERESFGQRYISVTEYVSRYKWWLKDKFKNDKGNNDNE